MNNPKAVAISEFYELLHTDAGRKIATLLDIMLGELRVYNDTACPDVVRYNQGGINVIIRLKEYLERGR